MRGKCFDFIVIMIYYNKTFRLKRMKLLLNSNKYNIIN